MTYYCGFSYREAYNLPVVYKRWFIERVAKEIKGPEDPNNPNGPGQGNSRAPHHNPPDIAALQGKTNPNAPARLRRFS